MSLILKPKVSVILVVYNEEKYIANALRSIYKQSLLKSDIELLVVDGYSTDKTIEICNEFRNSYIEEFFDIQILMNSKKILAAGWNLGIRNSSADYVVRFDGHSTIDERYLEEGLKELSQLDDSAVCVGGWMLHHSDTAFGKKAALFYSSPFGGGSAAFRRKPSSLIESDTALFAIYRKDIMLDHGCFSEDLVRNQDIDFHKRLSSSGYKFFTSPRMKVNYFVRSTLQGFLSKSYKDGFWVGASKGYYFRHLAPFFLFSYMLLCTIFAILANVSLLFIFIPLMLYCLVVLIDMMRSKSNFKVVTVTVFLFLFYHLTYGYGTTVGFIKRCFK